MGELRLEYERHQVDFGRKAEDYARHRQGFPPELGRRLAALGVGLPGQRVVDLGTGTGTLARLFGDRGCEVVGLDVSSEMLEAARGLSAGLPGVRFQRGCAEETGLPEGCAEVVSAGQCWHWFDRGASSAEARRLLTPGGALVISHLDWLQRPGGVLERTLMIVQEHHPEYVAPFDFPKDGIYNRWIPDLEGAGFTALETLSFDLDLLYTPEGWRGRMRASALVGAKLSPERAEGFDQALAAALSAEFPGEVLAIPHRVFAVVGFKDRPAMQA